jgi:predicted O-methyltransferase YrrM
MLDLFEQLKEMATWSAPELPTLQNPDACPYYAFLYHVAKALGPVKILEIGTDKGDSACHLAASRPDNHVITVDVSTSQTILDRIAPFPNIEFWHDNANDMGLPPRLAARGPFDIFFEDGEHSGGQVNGEWANYVPLVKPGGLIIMDDINLPTGIREFWDSISWPKLELSHLHHTGFGVVLKP